MLQFSGLGLKFKFRFHLTFFCVAGVCLAAKADVIHLKNGKTIVTDSASESNGRIEYTVGENSFSIPKTLVEKIDTSVSPSVPTEKPVIPPEALALPSDKVGTSESLAETTKIFRDGRIDPGALKAIEDEGLPEKSAAANFLAAVFEIRQSHYPAAGRYLETALHYQPDQPVMLREYAAVLLQLNHYAEALSYAERAVRADPQSVEALVVQGYAYYRNNRNADAVAAWKKALALRPSPGVQELIARVERESSTEADFHEQESSHFVLHYEGTKAPDSLRRELFNVLESQYNNLQNDLGASPRDSISVSLYTSQEFFDVTHAPAWTSALNDGKLRIPISGLTSVTPELGRVLRHELTHSFISQITHEHVPDWLGEGIAQLEEPLSTSRMGRQLAALYASGNQVPLNQLEGSFLNYNSDQAAVAYAESLAAAECIREKYGMGDIARLLQRLGEGEAIESAMRNTIHEGYAQFEAELSDYLKSKYGQ